MANLGWTLLDIRTDARLLLQERQGTQERYVDTDIDRWTNEGQQFIASVTRALRSSATAASVADQKNYSPPASAVAAWAIVGVDFDAVPLGEVPYEKRAAAMPQGLDPITSGTPAVYSILGQEVMLTPPPKDGTGVITYWFAYIPDVPADVNTALAIPILYCPALEWYVISKALYMKGQHDLADKAWLRFLQMLQMVDRKAMPDLAPEVSRGV